MKERPIIFSAPMVRAILAGTKTQTRRIVKDLPVHVVPFIGRDDLPTGEFGISSTHYRVIDKHAHCPYGAPGDRLWVKEHHEFIHLRGGVGLLYKADGAEVMARANRPYTPTLHRGRPSIHMPRWASRITLEITGVRVERLQDISEADAKAEGADPAECCEAHYHGFRMLWESIYGVDSWDANPFVWVVEFRRVDALREEAKEAEQ